MSRIVAGLDIGSMRITCAVAKYDEITEEINIVAGNTKKTKSVGQGTIINKKEAGRCIRELITELCASAEGNVSEVYVGLRGSYIRSCNSSGHISVQNPDEVTEDDVNDAIENSKALSNVDIAEIVHTIPQMYVLDEQRLPEPPIGVEGKKLEVFSHLVIAKETQVRNIKNAVLAEDYAVKGTVYTTLALGDVVLNEDEKDLGCLLIDLGGLTTSIALYKDGCLNFSRDINVGGDHITKDIAYRYEISTPWAIELKEKYGSALLETLDDDKPVLVPSIGDETEVEITPSMLVEDVIKFRVEEIFTKVKDALDENNLGGTFREIVLTGGGANLRGMSEAAKIMLSESEERPIRTRIGYIKHDKIKECDLCRSQELMGAVGVLSYALLNGGLENDSEDDVKDELLYTAKKMTNKLLYKVKNLFN